jgi:hypothetical protein
MNRHRIVPAVSRLALATMLAGGLAALAAAQTAPRRGAGPMYNTATEVTLKGTVEAVHQLTGSRNWAGTHLTLKTGKETIDVAVGPSWYLAQHKISFAKGDRVEVTGSKVNYESGEYVIAREVRKGDKAITLRNAAGVPIWSRSRRGNGSGARSR